MYTFVSTTPLRPTLPPARHEWAQACIRVAPLALGHLLLQYRVAVCSKEEGVAMKNLLAYTVSFGFGAGWGSGVKTVDVYLHTPDTQ